MKKKILLILMLIAAVVVIPVVRADDGEVDITIPDNVTLKIKDNTATDTKTSGTSSIGVDGDVITITYDFATFKILNNSGSRPANKAWIGFSITLPTSGISKYTLKREGSTTAIVTDGVVHGSSDNVVNVYAGFDEADLKKATDAASNVVSTYILTITTQSTGTVTKTIKVVIAPEKITLKDQNGSTDKWNETMYKNEVKEVMSDIYSDLEGAISVAKGIDKTKYTDETVKALEEVVKAAEDAGKDLTKNNQSEVRALTAAITAAIANLKESSSETVKPDSTTDNKPNEEAPNTFDAGLTYVGLALSAVGASVVSIKKLRNN